MKFKRLMLICGLALIFLIMGSVYSAEDINDAVANDTILTSNQGEIISQESDDFNCTVNGIDVNNEYETVANMEFTSDYDAKGNMTVLIDGEPYYNQSMETKLSSCADYEDEQYNTNFDHMLSTCQCETENPITYGSQNITVKNVADNGERPLANTNSEIYYYFEVNDLDLNYGEKGTLFIFLPDDADGTLTLHYNGKTKKIKYTNKICEVELSYKEFKFGENKIYVTLTNDSTYPDIKASAICTVHPNILPNEAIYDSFIINNKEKAYITIKVDKKMSGTFKLYNTIKKRLYDDYENSYYYAYYKGKKVLASVKVVNGVGKLPINKFKAGYYDLYLVYDYKKYHYEYDCKLSVVKNSPKIKISFSRKSIYEGGKVKATIKSPKANELMKVMVDGKVVCDGLNLENGKISKTFSKLKPGTHKIRFYMDEKKLQYSKVFTIKVKSKIGLSVKNIAVKKSSKKFTLKATLKFKGKAFKNKMISFKLKGKIYKAKTNKKGIAKVTLKKSKLKKIKVGQKIKFQVSYDKKTVTKKITIKK